jgi:hypothetical protein
MGLCDWAFALQVERAFGLVPRMSKMQKFGKAGKRGWLIDD